MIISNVETQKSNQMLSSSSEDSLLLCNHADEINQNFKISKFSSLSFSNKKELFIFFADHISDLIDLAFKDTETEDSKKAFIFLSNGPPLIIDALTKDFIFFLRVTELLQDPSSLSNSCIIQRISVIFNYLILNDVQFSIDSIGFLPQLLPYIGEDAVYDLFHTIFTNKSQLKQMRIMLSSTSIDTYVINEIQNSPGYVNSSSFSTYSKELNLLLIIRDGLTSKHLKKSFQNDKVLNALYSISTVTKEPLLLNQIWASLALIVNQNLISKMKDVFDESMKIISQPFERLHSYHISIFDFLANIVDTDASMFTTTQKRLICQTFQNLSLKFPNSTYLISSMFNFIRKSLHNREFAQRILDGYISFFIELGKSEKRTAVSASSLIFLADLEEMKTSSYLISKYLSENRKYISFHKSFFKNYLDELHKPYGGNIQICSSRK